MKPETPRQVARAVAIAAGIAALAGLSAAAATSLHPGHNGGRSVDGTDRSATARLPLLTTFAASTFTDPHGASTPGVTVCTRCHDPHVSSGPRLSPFATERETCYQCHNGSGASANIQADFGEATLGASTKASFHPVPSAKDGVQLVCTDCHTPHWNGTEVTKQLRIHNLDGSYTYSTPAAPLGNTFCYSCHGAPSTYPAPLGDHSSFQTSIHNTAANVPDPPSGSAIKCLACHAPHATDTPRLGARWDQKVSPAPDPSVEKSGEDLCYTCHTGTTNSSGGPDVNSPATDPFAAFTAGTNDYTTTDGDPVAIFHHPIAPSDQASGARTVECASCHNSHIVDRTDSATTSKIVNPGNVNLEWYVNWLVNSSNWDMNRTSPWTDMVSFCESCHVSAATTQPVTAGANVPYTVHMVNDTATEGGRPHDKFSADRYNTQEIHGSGAKLACTACHDVHGSSNAFALKERVVSAMDGTVARTVVTGFQNSAVAYTADSEKIWSFCRNCHFESGNPNGFPHNKGRYCFQCHYHNGGRL